MLCVWGVTVLLLLPAQTEAQSGDADSELRLGCTSHIMITGCSLTCRLVGGRSFEEDDEDDEDDIIDRISVCFTDLDVMAPRCLHSPGATLSSPDLSPLVPYNVTAHLKRAKTSITSQLTLTDIVKPRSPRVLNVSFQSGSKQTVILIQTPYHKDYLKVQNQMFQLHIWTSGHSTVQNLSSSDVLKVDTRRLKSGAQYEVRVRSLPIEHLKGSWSEWSPTVSFITPGGDQGSKVTAGVRKQEVQLYGLMACLVPLLVTSCVLFFWKKKEIFSFMWPTIPHPKDTLVQICKPNKGLLLNFRPEEFSALKVVPVEEPERRCDDVAFSRSANGSELSPPCSTQTSECSASTSAGTEELELCALLDRCSSDRGDDPGSPSHLDTPEGSGGGLQVEAIGGNQQEEAYVTMSSFFQIRQ